MNNKPYKAVLAVGMAAFLRTTSAVLGLAATWSPTFNVAMAQPSTASLTGVTSSDRGDGTRVLLSFDQNVSDFSIEDNDSARPTLSFTSAVMGAQAQMPPASRGLLKAIEVNQKGSRLAVSLVGSGPIHVDATASGGHAVSLTIALAATAKPTAGDAPASGTSSILSYVDPKPSEDAFEVVPLSYADVSEVVGLLSAGQPIKSNDNFTPQEPAFGASGFNGPGSGGGGQIAPQFNPNVTEATSTAYGQLIDDSIGVDRRLNAIVLRGSSERIARLKAKIAALDVPVQSVLLETIFVELTEKGARDVGFNFNNANGQIAAATYGRGTNGSYYGAGAGGGPGGGLSSYGTFALQAALYAQVQKGEGRIVSRPRISAQSGRSAKIITGDAVPILTSIALSGVNAVSQQVQYVNVGVTLQIAPRVSRDGNVTSHVFAEVSSVTGYSQGYPTISQREASTSATVKDGDYFIIGGLTQESHLKTRSKIPGLGDIPGAGELFKLHEENGSKTELYIVVTPHIVREGDSEMALAMTKR